MNAATATWMIGAVCVLTIVAVYYWVVRRGQQDAQQAQPQGQAPSADPQ